MNNLLCKIGIHKWKFIFSHTFCLVWTNYYECERCRKHKWHTPNRK